MRPFAKDGSRTKIESRGTSAEDERQHDYNEPVHPIDIDRVEAPVTFKVAQAFVLRDTLRYSLMRRVT